MKKMLALILMILMLTVCAQAENVGTVYPQADAETMVDLDGDGVQEILTWRNVEISEYDQIAEIRVRNDGGEEIGWGSELLYGVQVALADVDSDGLVEIFVTGDEMSDDYATYCLHYSTEALTPVLFADAGRGDNTDEYYDRGYGLLTQVSGSEIVLTGSQDMLGTWMAERRYGLVDGVMELVDDGYWFCNVDVNDPEAWEYRSLNPVQEIPVTFVEDYEMTDGALQPGERILLTRFDKIADAFFVTEDGRSGYLTAQPDEESGYGWVINNIPESELFETIPYAD